MQLATVPATQRVSFGIGGVGGLSVGVWVLVMFVGVPLHIEINKKASAQL